MEAALVILAILCTLSLILNAVLYCMINKIDDKLMTQKRACKRNEQNLNEVANFCNELSDDLDGVIDWLEN